VSVRIVSSGSADVSASSSAYSHTANVFEIECSRDAGNIKVAKLNPTGRGVAASASASRRKFVLAAASCDEMMKWVYALQSQIVSHDPFHLLMTIKKQRLEESQAGTAPHAAAQHAATTLAGRPEEQARSASGQSDGGRESAPP
jgi:hypothetical protein